MTLIVTMQTPQGIVMSADSLKTSFIPIYNNGVEIDRKCVFRSEYGNKIFMMNSFGISTCGEASIKGIPIDNYIESFMAERNINDIHELSDQLLGYFSNIASGLNITFHVAGYDKNLSQHIYIISLCDCKKTPVPSGLGASRHPNKNDNPIESHCYWAGDTEAVSRLLKPIHIKHDDDTITSFSSNYAYNSFNLQDSIDFCLFLTNATIGSLRFQERDETVGGNIDILLIKPRSTEWIDKKNYHTSQHRC